MNYLAHLYLAGDDSELLIGGLMGDFVKGRVDPARPAAVRAGILLHRRVDSFTDQHPVVRRSKARIDPEFRRYAGILVDLFFDHFLACDWPAYSRQPLPQYARRIYRILNRQLPSLPPRMQHSVLYMVRDDLLVSYREIDGIRRALSGIERRLSRPSRLAEAVAELEANYASFREDFAEFFPELSHFARQQREACIEETMSRQALND